MISASHVCARSCFDDVEITLAFICNMAVPFCFLSCHLEYENRRSEIIATCPDSWVTSVPTLSPQV